MEGSIDIFALVEMFQREEMGYKASPCKHYLLSKLQNLRSYNNNFHFKC